MDIDEDQIANYLPEKNANIFLTYYFYFPVGQYPVSNEVLTSVSRPTAVNQLEGIPAQSVRKKIN